MRKAKGFTLIEVLIVVTLIAILTAIALPSYQDYVLRGKITEATSTLSELRIRAEKWFANNRTYVGFNQAVPGARYFAYDCNTPAVPTATAYTCQAVGVPAQGMNGFTYTIDDANTRTSTITVSGWNNSATCWVSKKGESC